MMQDDGSVNDTADAAAGGRQTATAEPFWRKPLAQLSDPEWESLCDGCGRCCLIKLEDEDTGAVHFTNVACRLLDHGTCRCRDYPNRQQIVPDCIRLTRENVGTLGWLPKTCAYRLRSIGQDLPEWHPLVTGDPESTVKAGISCRGRIAAGEAEVDEDDLPQHIVRWPDRWPGRRRKPA